MRHHSSIAIPGALSAAIDSNATNIQVADATGWPSSFPHTAVLDPDTTLEEIVTVTAAVGNTWTVIRGQDGTAKLPHESGAVVEHMATARDYREPQEHIDASTNVHGVTSGSVVGTSQSQTLTNKTVSGSSNTLTNIPQSSVTSLTTDLDTLDSRMDIHIPATTGIHGVTSGDIVGTSQTQTLTGKTISGANNTLSSIAFGSIPGLPTLSDKMENITDIACGVATSVSFNGSGNAIITHGLGWTPTVMIFQPLLVSGLIHVSHLDAGVMNSTAVDVRATNNTGIYTASVSKIFWIAIRSA